MNETQIQTVLKHLSSQLHRFIDTIGEIPYVALPSERPDIICFARKVNELSGYDANEILADRQHWANIIHPDDQQRVFDAFAQCKNKGTCFEIEYRIIHKNGTLRYVVDKGEPAFNDEGKIAQVEGAISAIGRSGRTESIPVVEMSKVIASGNCGLGVIQKI